MTRAIRIKCPKREVGVAKNARPAEALLDHLGNLLSYTLIFCLYCEDSHGPWRRMRLCGLKDKDSSVSSWSDQVLKARKLCFEQTSIGWLVPEG
jgi:hypothetical protein